MSEDWISAKEAREIVAPGWMHGSPATDPIRQRAKNGVITARASVYVSTRSGRSKTVHGHQIPKEFWGGSPFKENWTTGDFFTGIHESGLYTDCEALGVTFERTGIEALAPPSGAAGNSAQAASSEIAVVASASKNSGGNPGKYDWAKAVGEIIFQWSDSGSWHPQSQGEVKKKLYEWFADKGQAPDDRQLKSYARWLFSKFKSRDPESE